MDRDLTEPGDDAADRELAALLDAIYRNYHHDFRGYAARSLQRRIGTALLHFQCPSIAALSDRVVGEPATFAELLRFLTVQVTDMFRDPPYFHASSPVAQPATQILSAA